MLIDQLLARHLSTLMAKVGGDLIGKAVLEDGTVRKIQVYYEQEIPDGLMCTIPVDIIILQPKD